MSDTSVLALVLSKLENIESAMSRLAAISRQSPEAQSSVEISHNTRGVTFTVKAFADSVEDAAMNAQNTFGELEAQYAPPAAPKQEVTLLDQLTASVEQVRASKADANNNSNSNVSTLPVRPTTDPEPPLDLENLPF